MIDAKMFDQLLPDTPVDDNKLIAERLLDLEAEGIKELTREGTALLFGTTQLWVDRAEAFGGLFASELDENGSILITVDSCWNAFRFFGPWICRDDESGITGSLHIYSVYPPAHADT